MTGAFRVAARNLRRNRRRNLATGLAVALGFAGLCLLGGYVRHVEAFLQTNAVFLQHGGHVTIYEADGLDRSLARPSRHSLTPSHQAAIRAAVAADPRVAFVGGYLRGMGLAGNGCRTIPFAALGIEPAVHRRILADPRVARHSADLAGTIRGKALTEYPDVEGAVGLASGLAALLGKARVHGDFASPPKVVPLPDCTGRRAAEAFASDANVQLAGLAFDGAVVARDVEVVNVFHTPSADTEDQALQARLADLQRLYDTDAVTYVAVFLHEARDALSVAADLRVRLRSSGVPVAVYPYTDERVSPYYAGSMAFLGSMSGFIVLIVASVVVLGVLNSTTLTVYERSREMGTLRAVGYTRAQVSALVVREVALTALLGLLAGLVIAHGVAAAVDLAGVRINPPGVPGTMRVDLTPGVATSLSLAALLVPLSLAVAWAVARRRLRERPSDLLVAVNA